MLTIEEMSAWTADDVQDQIRGMTPVGLVFSTGLENGVWFARFSDSATNDTLWEDFGIDRRILLFNAYGWVWMRQVWTRHKSPSTNDTPWVRRREITAAVATRQGNHIPDPEDLDPDEVAAVYNRPR